MEINQINIIETVLVLFVVIITRVIFYNIIKKKDYENKSNESTNKNILRAVSGILYILAAIILLFIWGIDHKELGIYISSTFAVIGIALFAQWSILSNVTAGIVLFFNHPIKIGSSISILDKDYPINGMVTDIGFFFTTIKDENNSEITIPNSVFINKSILTREQ